LHVATLLIGHFVFHQYVDGISARCAIQEYFGSLEHPRERKFAESINLTPVCHFEYLRMSRLAVVMMVSVPWRADRRPVMFEELDKLLGIIIVEARPVNNELVERVYLYSLLADERVLVN
jgi:hypothetical protein